MISINSKAANARTCANTETIAINNWLFKTCNSAVHHSMSMIIVIAT